MPVVLCENCMKTYIPKTLDDYQTVYCIHTYKQIKELKVKFEIEKKLRELARKKKT